MGSSTPASRWSATAPRQPSPRIRRSRGPGSTARKRKATSGPFHRKNRKIMRKLLIVAALSWTGVSFAQTVQPQQVQVKLTPAAHVHFVPPQELANKPNRPQAITAEYTVSMTVEGTTAAKQPWSVSIPLRTYVMQAARDPASGLPTGKRMHKPFVITMETDKATPLVQHLKANEIISSITLKFTPVVKAPSHTFVIRN